MTTHHPLSATANLIEQATAQAMRAAQAPLLLKLEGLQRRIEGIATAQAGAAAHATAYASFATSPDLLSLPASADAPEYDMQWMPPGPQDITCFVNGSPRRLTFTVTAKHAELFNQQLQTLLAKANAGQGDKPFTDYNHEDGAASSRPLRFTWGGNDPKTGGIRLIGKWTSKAREAIRDDEFERFSPQWDFDAATHEPLGIKVNLGGLVNKAAFQSIAKAQASDASDRAEKSPAAEPPGNWTDMVLNRARQKGISIAKAAIEIASEHPALAAQIAGLTHTEGPANTPFAPHLALENHPFVAQAKAMSAARGITETEALVQLARANFPLYQLYCASFQQAAQKRATAQAVQAGESGRSAFLREVQTAQALGLSFDAAVNAVASRRPDLAESYRRSFMPSVRSAR
jgi:hypothetical protein